ncbi:Asp-tRNA(Asn)/Glu-tRNA(Gln) amidotransferase subunit GatA [Pseudogracilibacillus auburnensis]|uniref:Glutamyl-tRNA(Gln) amidotransferase subunit A n=1 Tax=Pseudogracilibacillus auburnensis TaxID=1494959 RepID=A0A2V3WBV1_9BACI|nr:Asp-tRNA(Asn)/Glu-tRNA(Gln) amidotransferase subunit GatA [Pseudogracilibacillus auburnensis]MBO1001199.1 Asp-tRNA(Asn)/Glu-tRNA(Gln) amidotransferase subunit GatA [Pseudogracilibacillus auburnensis]PXW90634.1 aspartyl/glutamyl-tRNA(Asn/Gln) amidotransferase subunit A [Pseudogracilibacillus auburnensis]
MALYNYTIKQVENMLHKKEISAEELANLSFEQIRAVDGDVKAFLTLNEENVKAKAKKLDEEKTYGKKLAAIPGAIKDNIVTKGIRTTCASQMLANFDDPLYDATVTEKLANEDSLMIGKLNMDEFAMGSSTETSSFQKTYNPWNLDHVPGGSSGGSAAAVAAGEVMFSLGTDTGGSIRQPAAFCGIVGMKPTYGLVSRFGLVAFAPSLDQIGPLTRTVEDNARVLEVIAGHDANDSTSSKNAIPSYVDALVEDVKGLKIAVPKQFLSEGVSEEVKESVKNALQMYELLGATWEEVSLPHLPYADAAYYLIANGEASSSLARFDGVRFGNRSDNATDMIDMFKQSRTEGFGEEVKRRILMGTTVLSGRDNFNEAYFRKAQKVRTLIANDFKAAFEQYDVIIGPTTPTPAFKFGEKIDDPLTMYTSDILTVPVNLAGLPALSVPNGYTEAGLPLGLQIIGKHFDEQTIYRAAYAYEKATNHHKKRPNFGGASE